MTKLSAGCSPTAGKRAANVACIGFSIIMAIDDVNFAVKCPAFTHENRYVL